MSILESLFASWFPGFRHIRPKAWAKSCGLINEHPKEKRVSYGFTLLEGMVSLAIIAIALTAILGEQARNVAIADSMVVEIKSALLAQGKMAELETINPGELSSGSGDFGDDFPGYKWQCTVEDAVPETRISVPGCLNRIDLQIVREKGNKREYIVRMYRFTPEIR